MGSVLSAMVERAPLWLRQVWEEIGGSPPPRRQGGCEFSSNSGMQVAPSVKAEVKSEPRAERGLGVSRGAKVESEPKVKSEAKLDLERPELGVRREALEPGVKSELKEAVQRPQLQGVRLRGVAKVNSQGEAKLAVATGGARQWYCRACGKISPAATGPST